MAECKDPENTILIELKDGTVAIELLADVAPLHTARMKELARAGECEAGALEQEKGDAHPRCLQNLQEAPAPQPYTRAHEIACQCMHMMNAGGCRRARHHGRVR